jgi:alkylation response protein AidB-like acyl-CoA dehydrogenase
MNPYRRRPTDAGRYHARRFATDRITPGFLWWAPKLAYDTIHQCLLMHGHGGYDRGPMEQRLRDVLGFQIGDGTAQIMKTVIARHRVGRAAVPA